MPVSVIRHLPALQVFPVVLALCVATTPAVADVAPAQPLATESAAVQTVLEGFIDSLNTADVNSLARFFATDATMFFPLASLPFRLEDKQQITAAFGAFFEAMRKREPGPRYMNLAPEDTRVQFLGDVAVLTFHLKGEEMISRRTLVLRKLSGTWLIVHLHASNLQFQKK
jgi:hypothetical protein